MALIPGSRLGPYEILTSLGAGGMGEVYRARDPRLAREVAIKVIAAEHAKDPERVRRFTDEARAAGALSHPNVLSVFDTGLCEGSPYLVLELLEGETLRQLLQRGPLPPRKAIEIAVETCRGLAAAHEKGIVHPTGGACSTPRSTRSTATSCWSRLPLTAWLSPEGTPATPPPAPGR